MKLAEIRYFCKREYNKLNMKQFITDYAVILAPVAVAVVTGIFYLIKKAGNHNNQKINNISDSMINQANGDINKTNK